MIVLPAIDLRAGRCVRLLRGDPAAETVYGNDPAAVAAAFQREGASMLHVVDLDAALDSGSDNNREAVHAVCSSVDVPVQVGGGMRTLADVAAVLELGAARVVLGTAAVREPAFVGAAVARFGERIVVAVDVRDGAVMVRGWREAGGMLEDVVAALDAAGAPRYLATSIGVDGTQEGPDLGLYGRLRSLTDRPVLASGGVSGVEDLRALAALGVEGVVVGRALYEGTLRLSEALGVTAA